jgi:ubiquinone/menaquinone biosynthesis C-methylase UbiE
LAGREAAEPVMNGYYETRLTPNEKRAEVWRHIAAYLAPWVDADGALLDLAAGYADVTRSSAAARKVAIDSNPRLPQLVGDNIEAIVGDATDLSAFDEGEFTTVIASNFIEHLDHDIIDALLDDVHRVLHPGGHLVLIQPNFRLAPRRYFDDYTHRTIWTDTSLSDLLVAHGYRLSRVEPRFLPLTMKSRLSFGHRLVPLYLRLPYRPLAGQMLLIAERPRGARDQ